MVDLKLSTFKEALTQERVIITCTRFIFPGPREHGPLRRSEQSYEAASTVQEMGVTADGRVLPAG